MDIHNHLVHKHQVMQRVEGHLCSLGEAARSLGLSYRQTKRWWRRYQEACGSLLAFADHSPRGGGWNKKSSSVIQAVLDNKRLYPHRSVQHIADDVSEREERIASATVRRILEHTDLLVPKGVTLRVHTRFEAAAFGERLQMDTTSGAWMIGYRLVYLIAVIDDHSRMLVGWKWVDSDSAWNNMQVLRSVYEKYGLPKTLYTDNASMFKTIRHNRSIYQNHKQEGYETEIQRCMKELGVTMFSHKPYEPQSKGKVERFFRFMQERFVREHTAKNLAEMNEQFAVWTKWYNQKHVNRTTGQKPKDRTTPSAFAPAPNRRRLDSAFSFKLTRKVDKCNTVHLFGGAFVIDPKYILPSRTVDIEYTPDEVRVYHLGTHIQTFTHGEACLLHSEPNV